MENNNKLQVTDNKLCQKDFNTNVVKAVSAVFVRLDQKGDIEKIKVISDNILDEYGDLPIQTIIEALKKGGRGKYGRTFRLSVQEVCIWIDSYLKENEKDIDNNLYEYFRYNDDHYLIIRRKGKNTPTPTNMNLIETTRMGSMNKQW